MIEVNSLLYKYTKMVERSLLNILYINVKIKKKYLKKNYK